MGWEFSQPAAADVQIECWSATVSQLGASEWSVGREEERCLMRRCVDMRAVSGWMCRFGAVRGWLVSVHVDGWGARG